jgi:hypothetical protein
MNQLGFSIETLPADCEVIVSETLDIVSDAHGKQEYRVYVLRDKAVNVSRYIDYRTDYDVPKEIYDFARTFVLYHRDILPHGYVLDIGIDEKRGPVVIGLNPLIDSGRYEKNDFNDLLDVFVPRKLLCA